MPCLTRAFCFAAVVLLATAGRAQAPTPAAAAAADASSPWKQYVQLIRENTVQLFKDQPFELHFDYQLYTLEGKPSVAGTVVKNWGDGAPWHVQIHSSTLDVTEPSVGAMDLRTVTRENFLVHQALDAITLPLPYDVKEQGFAMYPVQERVGGVQVDCFTLVAPEQRAPETAAYCANEAHVLTTMTGEAGLILLRKDFRHYRGREVPMEIELSYNGRLALTAHVTELDMLRPPAGQAASDAGAQVGQRVDAKMMAGSFVKKKMPKYPGAAKAGHIGGTVLICAEIDEQGKIGALDVVAGPDPMLNKAAYDAVKTWTYKPYLLDGKPTDVNTTIRVNFNLNGR